MKKRYFFKKWRKTTNQLILTLSVLSIFILGLPTTLIAGNFANAALLNNKADTTLNDSQRTDKNSEEVAKQAAIKAEAAAQEIKGRPHQDLRARGRLEKTSDRVDRAIEKAGKRQQ
jgi:ElaB/YqjD/DUF883 family membrane-anchored ribosome-binding protein